jgi:putative DNA primase/helicase
LHGVWLMEIGELAGLRKAEVATIKHFISKTEDRYRMAYGKRIGNFPRQCVFFPTTNNAEFLRNDANGNRKFWPVTVHEIKPTRNIFMDLTPLEVGQIWAEAVQYLRKGEPLHLSEDLENEAFKIQDAHTEQDERTGIIAEYLDQLIPAAWEAWDIDGRRSFLTGGEFKEIGTRLRNQICVAELWCELFGNRLKDLNTYNTKDIHAIMRNIPGWAAAKAPRMFKIYGKQRAYYRVENIPELFEEAPF